MVKSKQQVVLQCVFLQRSIISNLYYSSLSSYGIRAEGLAFAPHTHQWDFGAHEPVTGSPVGPSFIRCEFHSNKTCHFKYSLTQSSSHQNSTLVKTRWYAKSSPFFLLPTSQLQFTRFPILYISLLDYNNIQQWSFSLDLSVD